MKRKEVAFIIAIGLIVIVVGFSMLLFWGSASKQAVKPQQPVLPSPAPVESSPKPVIMPSDESQQLSLKSMSREEAIKIYVERLKQDPASEGKVSLSFYGKVVDENNQPVAGATVHLQWNTVDSTYGTADSTIFSDGGGLFSLTGKRGKVLGVRVEKEGYYTVEGGQGSVSFEYADPSSPSWYEPDSNSPVIFHLHKKGDNTAHLLHWKRDVALGDKMQIMLDLKTGAKANGQGASLLIEILENQGRPPDFAWSARVSTIGAGLQMETDQFPFIAPTTGYQQSIELNRDTPKPPNWDGNQGAAFYVQTPQGYGRCEVKMDMGANWIEVESYFNPTPGDRNLEYDPDNP